MHKKYLIYKVEKRIARTDEECKDALRANDQLLYSVMNATRREAHEILKLIEQLDEEYDYPELDEEE